ncbi:hypothetical protein [Streptomyces sp. NBC_00154]|uniref:hypothetical protein n=1 Tax=Streptomyces sp. NBC_00154 TaxID=2975670 RepID=UPI002251BDCD|nr:hypothetical protein [Streptomyces sp. NBC_00154]MCX5315359.1 hypothetical protein [Streptomyces sp. NBC_00154]
MPVVVPAQPLDLLDETVHAVGKIAALLQIRARVTERLDEAGGVAEVDPAIRGRTGSECRAAIVLLPGAIVPVRQVTGLLAGASTLRACPDEHRPVP